MVEVFVLGAGTPTPTEYRFGSAHALRIGDEVLMFDCGPLLCCVMDVLSPAMPWLRHRPLPIGCSHGITFQLAEGEVS